MLKNGMGGRGMDSSGSGYVKVVGCCEHDDETSAYGQREKLSV